MNTMQAVLVARLATELEVAAMHLREAAKITEQLREGA